jgi:carbon monoxide dehydrogenase subunit G
MELKNEFRVAVPVDEAFGVLTNVERIAPCMPGAQLQEIESDEYRGIVKVKVGPITAQYKGAARFVELDKDAHRAVLRAEGRDTRGQGNANATITAELEPDGDGTNVTVVTDLTVTGRVAQFGRGVMADVSTKLLGQFVECLEHEVLAAAAGPSDGADTPNPAESTETLESTESTETAEPKPTTEATSPNGPAATTTEPEATVRRIESPDAEPVDLLDAAGAPVAKRAVPVVVGVVAFLWLVRVFVRRRKRRKGDS